MHGQAQHLRRGCGWGPTAYWDLTRPFFTKHQDCIHAVICSCLSPRGIRLVGVSWRNGLEMKLLRRLAESLLAGGRPWILAGDWNVPPQALIDTGFVAKTGGQLKSQQRNTSEMGKGSNICYVVLSRQMESYYSDHLGDPGPIPPHHPLFINFSSNAEEPSYQDRTKPKASPVKPPIGCQRAPRRFRWANLPQTIVPDVARAGTVWSTNVEAALVALQANTTAQQNLRCYPVMAQP